MKFCYTNKMIYRYAIGKLYDSYKRLKENNDKFYLFKVRISKRN